MPKLIDPLKALPTPAQSLKEDRKASAMPSAAEIVKRAPTALPVAPTGSLEARCKADFRVFLTVIWRHLLGNDPNPIQLDMAYWLQHGPDRAIIMAFRGFSKSWITGAYALWRLYCNPDEKIIVVSGSLLRSLATTNWCLQLIMTVPILAAMQPKADYRQSSRMFDVGNCIPQQSASFMATGIGGQLPGFRASLIIPDDVETQTNSLTVAGREKNLEAVKEFESILLPGGAIKYLGTPHDIDSLYLSLLRLKDDHGRPVYHARIWPALFPSDEEQKAYGPWLAPYVVHQIGKLGPSCVGHSTMPMRFTDEDLANRRAAMGTSEFRLQFMLDLRSLKGKYPLRLKDLVVMDLDDNQGPDTVIWGTTKPLLDLPVMGTDGDFYYGPVEVEKVQYLPWNETVGFIDPSGRGEDETSLSIASELHGRVFWRWLEAWLEGFEETTLVGIAKACVRFRVGRLLVEENFGGGMFVSLLRPVLLRQWEDWKEAQRKAGVREPEGGTVIEEVTASGKVFKEKRILSVLEPVTQQHRLVVNKAIIQWDHTSIQGIDGDDRRTRYAWAFQYSHITAEPKCLGHDDRLESLAGVVTYFAPRLGVDPLGAAQRSREERYSDDLERLLYETEDAVGRGSERRKGDGRVEAARPSKR